MTTRWLVMLFYSSLSTNQALNRPNPPVIGWAVVSSNFHLPTARPGRSHAPKSQQKQQISKTPPKHVGFSWFQFYNQTISYQIVCLFNCFYIIQQTQQLYSDYTVVSACLKNFWKMMGFSQLVINSRIILN